MDQTIVTKNYFTDEGDTLVIGGKLIIEEGAEVTGLDGDSQVAPNQEASTATAVAALKNDFNALLIKLKDAGIMVPDSWNLTAGLAPTPTEEVLVSNKEKVHSVTLEDGQLTICVDVAELEESASSEPSQGTHKWLALEIGTGITDITAVRYNGSALTALDVSDAQATGCATGSFVLYVKTEELVETPKVIRLAADGYGETAITITVEEPVETPETNPAEIDPAETDPAETDPAETDPAETDPAE